LSNKEGNNPSDSANEEVQKPEMFTHHTVMLCYQYLLFPRLANSLSLSTDPVADNTLGRHSLSGSSSLGIIISKWVELSFARPTRHGSNEEPETQDWETADLNLPD
jgi:hypothetical protein